MTPEIARKFDINNFVKNDHPDAYAANLILATILEFQQEQTAVLLEIKELLTTRKTDPYDPEDHPLHEVYPKPRC